jgi:hypothetical protein
MVAEATTATADTSDLHGELPGDSPRVIRDAAEFADAIQNARRDPQPPATSSAPPALIVGGTILPAPLLAELIRCGTATVRPLVVPGSDSPPEPRYRPSTALADFVRCRDLTCRFPGCRRAADLCDIDHTTPYDAGGMTHPSNLKCLCRKHHLLKTFWTGALGWADRQLPDGTVIWTAPTGSTYTTQPGSKLLVPALCSPTGDLPPPRSRQQLHTSRGAMMPIRQRTRAADRLQRINAERRQNRQARLARRAQMVSYFAEQTPTSDDDEPPPF